MKFPNKEEAFKLLEKHQVPANIVQHSVSVAAFALSIAKKFNEKAKQLNEKGEKLNLQLTESLALLHDIAKLLELKQPEYVDGLSEKLLSKEGYAEFGRLVGNMSLNSILKASLQSWEEKLVYYSDKRIVQEKVVSLSERFDYFRQRYGKLPGALESINAAYPLAQELEKEILNKLEVEKL